MRILVADDDPILSHLLRHTLERLGHEVVLVDNGPGAVEILLRPDGPRLAILDWMMPGTRGPDVCREIRERTGTYVYLILLTARDGRDDMLEGLEAGADDFLTKPFDAVELASRLRSGARVLALQERLLDAQEALRIQATRDDLTGLWNRRMIQEQLAAEWARATRERRPLSTILADVDHFKRVNDEHGHAAGDAVLQEVARRMRTAVREYDAVGRHGGEEFLIVLPGCDADAARHIAERVRHLVAARPVDTDQAAVVVSVSLGVATRSDETPGTGVMVEHADQALYRAKTNGRNRVEGPPLA